MLCNNMDCVLLFILSPMDNMKKLTEAWMSSEDGNATETASDGQSEKKSAKNSRAKKRKKRRKM